MTFWLILLLVHPGLLIRNFIFDSSLETNISHVMLKTGTHLPQIFTICSSFKEDKINKRSFFTIYGDSNNPWITLSNWVYLNKITMWLKLNTDWFRIRAIPLYWINSWIHVCISFNSLLESIFVSVNGEPMISVVQVDINLEKPKDLQGKLFLGLSDTNWQGPKQYCGQVANFNIFSVDKTEPITMMSANPCGYKGDIINNDSQWDQVGMVTENLKDESDVCNNNQEYTVAIPTIMNWIKAEEICSKLGHGNITEAKTERDLHKTISLFLNMNSSCEYVWTPLVDEDIEGLFKSTVTKHLAIYLPWGDDQPGGGVDENNVAINIADKSYNDFPKSERHCAACNLLKTTEFLLIGVCQDTYFGKTYFFVVNQQ